MRARIHTYTHESTLPLVFVNIKMQNYYLNKTSACLCVKEWRSRAVLFTTCTECMAHT